MKVTYIGHSGFLIEWDSCYFLFDYYEGKIPKFTPGKPIYIFASHKHPDHFNREIFHLAGADQKVVYVLSSDIDNKRIADERIVWVKADAEYVFPVDAVPGRESVSDSLIRLQTLKSTDAGIAFLLWYEGKVIYHAGDLNLWTWKGESRQYNNNMTANFEKEMKKLSGIKIDVAFVPLDPRQEDWYDRGLLSLLEKTEVSHVFPMHFWTQPQIIADFRGAHGKKYPRTKIYSVGSKEREWNL